MPIRTLFRRPGSSVPGAAAGGRKWLYAALIVLALVILTTAAARLLLSEIAARRGMIEAFLGRDTGRVVRIAAVAPYWNGIHPGLDLRKTEVLGRRGEPLLIVPRLRVSMAWLPLLSGDIRPYSLEVVRPVFTVDLQSSGALDAGGFHIPTSAGPGGHGLRPWLFDQHDLIVRDGEVTWVDERHSEHIDIRHFNLEAKNGFRQHMLNVSADLPKWICTRCSFFVETAAVPTHLSSLSGQLYWHLDSLDVNHLPSLLRQYLPAGLAGRFTTTAWSKWKRGRPVFLSGTIKARRLVLPSNRWMSVLDVRRLDGDVSWRYRNGRWMLEVRNGIMGASGPAWSFGTLVADLQGTSSRIRVDHLNLDQASWLLAHSKLRGRVFTALRRIDPDGSLSGVNLQFQGPLSRITGYWLKAKAQNLTAIAYGPYPGFNGINGSIYIYKNGGKLFIDSMKGSLSWPRYFQGPLSVSKATGDLSWVRAASGWRIDSQHLFLSTADGDLGASLVLQLPASGKPQIALNAVADHIDLAKMRTFYSVIPAKGLRDWLRQSVRSGMMAHGQMHVQGDLTRFPFSHGGGQFQATATVVHGKFVYLSSWVPLYPVKAQLVFDQGSMTVDAAGAIGKLIVSPLAIKVSDFSIPTKAVVRIDGTATGTAGEVLRVLRRSGQDAQVPSDMVVRGDGQLRLHIGVPIVKPARFSLRGRYQTTNLSVALSKDHAPLSHVSGDVRFGRHGLSGGHLSGQLFGEPVSAHITRVKANTLIFLDGTTSAAAIGAVLPRLPKYVSGTALWHGVVRPVAGVLPIMQLKADLKDVAINLPTPLRKRRGQPETLEVSTVVTNRYRTVISAHLGAQISSELVLRRRHGIWTVPKGRITLGGQAAPLPRAPGIVIAMSAPRLDADRWLHVVSHAAGSGKIVSRLLINTGQFLLWHRDFGAVQARFHQTVSGGWLGSLSGVQIDGDVTYDAVSKPSMIRMNLKRLLIPAAFPPVPGLPPSKPLEPGALPEVALKSAHLQVGVRQLGSVDFLGLPEVSGWRIAKADFISPKTELRMHGHWYGGPRQSTHLDVALTSTDLGRTLSRFGVPGQVAGGAASLHGEIGWRGAPGDFQIARLDGQLAFSAVNGRFKRLHQGAGKLLGILDIHSIARYLTLNFSTVFKRGYVFDRIRGALQIHRGDATTMGSINVKGPSANLNIQGSTDLARQMFNLQVEVDPQFPTLTLAGASLFASPVAGAAVLLMQHVFKRQISENTRTVYWVRGPWSKPVIHEKPDGD